MAHLKKLNLAIFPASISHRSVKRARALDSMQICVH